MFPQPKKIVVKGRRVAGGARGYETTQVQRNAPAVRRKVKRPSVLPTRRGSGQQRSLRSQSCTADTGTEQVAPPRTTTTPPPQQEPEGSRRRSSRSRSDSPPRRQRQLGRDIPLLNFANQMRREFREAEKAEARLRYNNDIQRHGKKLVKLFFVPQNIKRQLI